MHAMDRTALRQALLEMPENNKGEPVERFDDDLNLRTDLGLDSVDLVSLVMDIQERFRVQLAVADLEPVQKVSDLLDLLQSKMAAPRAAA